MDKYIVLTGNEFGLEIIDDEIKFISLDKANELFEKYLEENGCAVMYEFTGYSIKKVKQKSFF